jgi:cobaltochelatase CobT
LDALWSLIRFIAPIVGLSLLGAFLARVWKGSGSPVADGPEDQLYQVYTREFDLVLPASEVLDRLDAASPDGAEGWLKGAPSDRQVLQVESLLADQRAALAPDRDGVIAGLRASVGDAEPASVVVAMLVDQSGSMKDRRIASVAVATTLIAELVDDLGARSELLGFSTAGWKGGHARLKWLKEGRPKRPGRLAALMHVIYKSADDPPPDEEARRVMVHPDLLRENIDGEAILWAWDRLAARPEARKILIVISDGAPVDDSTLMENGPSYLYRHLRTVLRQIEQESNLIVGGIGVEHQVGAFYPLFEDVTKLEEMPRAGIRLLERLLAASCGVAKKG